MNVEFDQRQIIKLAVMGVGILIAVMVAWSAFQQAQRTLTQPSTNLVNPAVETAPVIEPDRSNRPQKANR